MIASAETSLRHAARLSGALMMDWTDYGANRPFFVGFGEVKAGPVAGRVADIDELQASG